MCLKLNARTVVYCPSVQCKAAQVDWKWDYNKAQTQAIKKRISNEKWVDNYEQLKILTIPKPR